MGERCIRCGIGSGLVFQGGNRFICMDCLDESREIEGRQFDQKQRRIPLQIALVRAKLLLF